jgi:Fe-S-cluster containining protein
MNKKINIAKLFPSENVDVKVSRAFENGIEFSCQMCGGCCSGFEEGEVYLYLEDIEKLIKFLKLKRTNAKRNFAKKYLKMVDETFSWNESGETKKKKYTYPVLGFKFIGDDEHCEFLGEDNLCTVHEGRPYQCICFPFWQMMVSSKINVREYAKKCPGLKRSLKNEGKFYSREEIQKFAQKEYEMEKEYFLRMKANDFDILKVYPFLPKEMVEEYLKKKENV